MQKLFAPNHALRSRTSRAVVLNSGCTLEALGETFKIPMSEPHPRTIKSEFLGVEPRHKYFLNLPRWFQSIIKVENHSSREWRRKGNSKHLERGTNGPRKFQCGKRKVIRLGKYIPKHFYKLTGSRLFNIDFGKGYVHPVLVSTIAFTLYCNNTFICLSLALWDGRNEDFSTIDS